MHINSLLTKSYNAPLHNLNLNDYRALRLGEIIRESVWQYPILPGALLTYMQMVAGREWVVSSTTATKSAKTVDFFNNAVCRNWDGTVSYGFEEVLRRFALDALAMGKFYWTAEDGEFEYLDPRDLVFNPYSQTWSHNDYLRQRDLRKVVGYTAIPIGSHNYKIPLGSLIPAAVMQWLVREHDTAAADGRKIRDIYITLEGINTSLEEALKKNVDGYMTGDFSKNGVSVVEIALPDTVNLSAGFDVAKLVHRMGIAEIPEGYNRADEEFKYVNEIAGILGLALRHFWNSEKATNRALEEVQEARQQQKGPGALVRSIARTIRGSTIYQDNDLGSSTTFAFVEEVDLQTAKTDSEVLVNYANAFATFKLNFGDQISLKQLLAWLQGKRQLPPDITLDETGAGTMQTSDEMVTPLDGSMEESDPTPKPVIEKRYPIPEYDHYVMNSSGELIEKRLKVYAVPLIERELENDPEFMEKVHDLLNPPTVEELIKKSVSESLDVFKEVRPIALLAEANPDRYTDMETIPDDFEKLTEKQIQIINEVVETWG